MTSYVKTEHLSQKRNFIRNVLQSTRSLCHFRFKSYGPLYDFHKSGDLDLALCRIFKKKIAHSPWYRIHHLSKFQDDRTSGVVCTSRNDRQTDRQTNKQTAVTNILCENRRFRTVTNRGDQYTLQKSTILQSNERALRECILCKIGLTD